MFKKGETILPRSLNPGFNPGTGLVMGEKPGIVRANLFIVTSRKSRESSGF